MPDIEHGTVSWVDDLSAILNELQGIIAKELGYKVILSLVHCDIQRAEATDYSS